MRITATVHLGDGHVVDIEREAALGGPVHSKGVLILSSYLGSRYAAGVPLSLAASLVFEQSYDTIEGDSASLAELCALLSALAGAPIRQSLAVAVREQRFAVHAVDDVDQAIGLLTGLPAGAPNLRGLMPEHSINQRVAAQLAHMSALRQAFEMGLCAAAHAPAARGVARAAIDPALNAAG